MSATFDAEAMAPTFIVFAVVPTTFQSGGKHSTTRPELPHSCRTAVPAAHNCRDVKSLVVVWFRKTSDSDDVGFQVRLNKLLPKIVQSTDLAEISPLLSIVQWRKMSFGSNLIVFTSGIC